MGSDFSSLFRLIADLTDRVDGDKCLGVYLLYIVHERFIFVLVNDGNDLLLFSAVISTDDIVKGCSAVQIVENKIHNLIKLGGDDADTALQIHTKK